MGISISPAKKLVTFSGSENGQPSFLLASSFFALGFLSSPHFCDTRESPLYMAGSSLKGFFLYHRSGFHFPQPCSSWFSQSGFAGGPSTVRRCVWKAPPLSIWQATWVHATRPARQPKVFRRGSITEPQSSYPGKMKVKGHHPTPRSDSLHPTPHLTPPHPTPKRPTPPHPTTKRPKLQGSLKIHFATI